MAHCDDIAPLLSAFNDGELPAHETDLVTQHLDGCETCKETLIDYLLLGHHLRTATATSTLDGFTARTNALINFPSTCGAIASASIPETTRATA